MTEWPIDNASHGATWPLGHLATVVEMHILQLLPSLEVGGVERGVLDLSKGLIQRGHRVSVVSGGGALVEVLTQLGAVHHQLPIGDKSLFTFRSSLPVLARLIKETGVDVVHARSRVPALAGFIAARWAQCAFVTTAHGFYRPHLGSRVMTWGRIIIAPSEALKRYLIDTFQVSPQRLRVIPRGVDLSEFSFQPPSKNHEGTWRIGLFGRLSSIKGHDVAFRACALLVERGIPIRLCIAGDTPGSSLRQSLESLAASLKLTGVIEWLGRHDNVAQLVASVDIVIVPSVYPESFGRAVIEAQAVGRPVIASRIGALAELIEEAQDGLLISSGDAQALADGIVRLVNDPALRARCIKEGRRKVEEHYGVDQMVEKTIEVYEDCITKPRVLIWKLSALGDVVLSTPSLRAIRRQYPKAPITMVVGRSAYEVVARCPYLDEVIVYDPARKDKGLARHVALIRRLRLGAFDISIDLQNSRRTHILAWLSGIPVRIGFYRKFGWLLNRGVRLPRVVLAPIAHQHYLLRTAGLSTDGETLELWPSSLDEQRVLQLIPPDTAEAPRLLVGLHPGGSGRWKTKRWALERWARLCDGLSGQNARIVIVGGPNERDIGEALLRLVSSKPIVVIGKTSLLELACLIKRCAVFVAHDSSSLHLAAAVGTPTVALFGPTDPARHLPPNCIGQVIRKEVFCSPCYATSCRTITYACMRQISVEEVLGAVLGLLSDA